MADLTQFDVRSARRIARVVQAVEQEPRRARPLTFGAATEQRREKPFRVCTFTGSWGTSSIKTVTLKYRPAITLSALNLTFHLPDIGTGPYDCEVAKDGTAWFLVSALEQNVKRGTFTGPWSKGATANVTLTNGGSVVAQNRHAAITASGTRNCTVGRDGMAWELIAAEC
jgi:hypothetical protein